MSATELPSLLYHGASPGRWARWGASIDTPSFDNGCYLTPNPAAACLYCADWSARPDRRAFIQHLIDDMFAIGDCDELMNCGFIRWRSDGFGHARTEQATADFVLTHWSAIQISHLLVQPYWAMRSHGYGVGPNDYPFGAAVFPMRLRTNRVLRIECGGRNYDDIPGDALGMPGARLRTDDAATLLRGQTDAIWFRNLVDLAHCDSVGAAGGTVFVYDPQHLEFALTGESPAALLSAQSCGMCPRESR